ncbi:MAG TPA: SGNH/GDSL hydrolase family protein [bacterium]|nr:SGNH/GDSL hydrolase family protein [bacterium]
MTRRKLSAKWIWLLSIGSLVIGFGGNEIFRQIGLHHSKGLMQYIGNPKTFWTRYFYFITCWKFCFVGVGLALFVPALFRRPRELAQVIFTRKALFRLVWIGYLLILIFVCEQLCHCILFYKEKVRLTNELDPYEEVHPKCVRLWRLKPGYHCDASETAKEKRESGHWLGALLYEHDLKKNTEFADYELHINSLGIRGDEPQENTYRILCLGDSCTFGPQYNNAYPDFIEHHLNTDLKRDKRFDVINGAVEAYSAIQIVLRYRLDFMNLKPDLVIVFVGWNSMIDFDNNPINKHPRDTSVIVNNFKERTTPAVNLKKNSKTYIGYLFGSLWKKSKKGKENSKPSPFYRPIESTHVCNYPPRAICLYLNLLVDFLIEEVHLSPDKIVLCTLPGLIQSGEAPSQKALNLSQWLPDWTKGNTYLYALAYEGYNRHIREICRQRGLHLIDLEQWSRENLQLDNDFFDLVHFHWYVHPMVGEYIAKNLETFI